MHFITRKFVWQEAWPWLVMVGFGIVSRWIFKSHYLFHLDSAQFALAINQWDIIKHQPHPPGYIIYIGLAKLLTLVVHDVNLSFVIISIIATLLGLWAFAWLANQWWGKTSSVIAGILYLTNASVWFHGLVAEVYMLEAALILWVVALAYRYWRKAHISDLLWFGLLLGLLGGVRQVGELVMLPLASYVIWFRHRFNWSVWIKFGATLIISNLLWLIPLLWLSHGFAVYWQAVTGLWANTVAGYYQKYHWVAVVKNFSLFLQTIKQSSPALFAVLWLGVLPFVAIESRRYFKINIAQIMFWVWWAIPSLILVSTVLITNPGYALNLILIGLLLTTGAVVTIGTVIERWQPRWANTFIVALAAGISLLQIWSFFTAPVKELEYASASLVTVRESDSAMFDILTVASRKTVSPDNTLFVIDGGYLVRGFRHLQYYLPEFDVYGRFFQGWSGVSQDGDNFIYAHGLTAFVGVSQVKVDSKITKIVMLGKELFPNINVYLSSLYTGGNGTSINYFDLTNPSVKQALANSGLFNFLPN